MLTSGGILEHSQNKESDFVYTWSINQVQRDFQKLPATGKVAARGPVSRDNRVSLLSGLIR